MVQALEIACTGYSISADWYEGGVDRVLLVLPGFTSSKARQKDIINGIRGEIDISVLAIDYSGHGESPFDLKGTRPAQHFLEVVCAFDWIADKYPVADIYVVGSSYGGFLATQLTKYRKFAKLVLRAPAIYRPKDFYDLWSMRFSDVDGYREAMDEFRRNAAELSRHPLLARASNFSGETLVVVHGDDELVPLETTDAYIKAFSADLYTAAGFRHSVGDSPIDNRQLSEYQKHIADWLK